MFRLKEVIYITGGKAVSADGALEILSVSTDSRTINKGGLFIALKGEHFDGIDFIDDAVKRGAAAVIAQKDAKIVSSFKNKIPFIKVEDTGRALSELAKAHREKFDIPIIGITGSNGKTTTKDMISHILSRRFKVLGTEKNYNNKIGVAQTLLRLKDEDIAIIEIGSNSYGEIGYNAAVLKPTVAIITNIGPSHLEGLRDKEGILREKIALVESLGEGGVWIKNSDDEMLSKKNYGKIKIITYGIDKERVDFKPSCIKQLNGVMEFTLRPPLKRDNMRSGSVPVKVSLLGMHNLYNTLAAIACCSLFVDIKLTREALLSFKAPHMRMELLDYNGIKIINDCYNSNPLSFRYAVSCLRELPASGKRIVVAADMLELGEDSDRLHYESGKFLAESKTADLLITFGVRSSNIIKGALDHGMDREKAKLFEEKDKIADFLRSIINNGDVILVKGSRGMQMEEVIDCFITCSTR